MRTVAECYQLLHEEDKESAVSKNYIRHLSKSGSVPVVHVGNYKVLINYDALCTYLARGEPSEQATDTQQGIRQIRS
jgi:hypothetical protein